MITPKVSVVMPVYNGEIYLREAVESILNQTFTDFEFLIINDGSTDETGIILKQYERADSRTRVYNQENKGVISSLNRGCILSQGKYIARMDADDISLPNRFEKQVNYMESHPEIGILGTWAKLIDEDGIPQKTWDVPTSPSFVKWSLLFRNCVVHPSSIMRTAVLRPLDFYRPEALHVEDYDLWARATLVTQIANFPEVLYLYRFWDGNICSRHSKIQDKNITEMIMPSMVSQLLGHKVSPPTLIALRQLSMDCPLSDIHQTKTVAKLTRSLYKAYFLKNTIAPADARKISNDAGSRLYALASFASKFSLLRGFMIYIQAIRMDPQLLSPRILIRVIKAIAKVLKKEFEVLLDYSTRHPSR